MIVCSRTVSYTHLDVYKRQDWSYTEKGWFIYELRVPEPPVVSEVVNGFEMIRVKPVEERAREIMREFLEPVGYQGHNLFSSDWDGEHLDGLDFNGLFEYMYPLKYNDCLLYTSRCV